MIGYVRNTLASARLELRLRLFGNNHSIATNRRYETYERLCHRSWHPVESPRGEDRERAAHLAQEGFTMVEPSITEEESLALGNKVDQLFDMPECVYPVAEGLYRFVDGLDRVPDIMRFVPGRIERVIEAYFRSHFKFYNVSFYRTVPNPAAPKSSFLWHFDNVPRQELKLMVYLDDVFPDTGAFRLKAKPLSDALRRKGCWHRHRVAEHMDILDDESTTVTVGGGPGTCVLFQNGKVMHKATAPTRLHRDVVTMVIIPSDIPWREHFVRNRHLLSTNAGICLDPFTDRPENIGYRY